MRFVGDEAVAWLAVRQHGVVSRRQLLGAGLSAEAIKHRLRAGRLHGLHRGAYAVGHSAVSAHGRMMAAVLACGPAAVLSHLSAASLWGLLRADGGPVHVTVVGGHREGRDGIRLHHTRELAPAERTRHLSLPVTRPLRTLVDLATTASAAVLTRAVEEAQLRRLVSLGELQC